jgi:glutaredoxin-like protein NrdH
VIVTVFTKPGCPPCDATKSKLDKHGVEYKVRDVTTDPEAKARVQELGYLGTPVVECGDVHWQGFSPDKCKQLADNLATVLPVDEQAAREYLEQSA